MHLYTYEFELIKMMLPPDPLYIFKGDMDAVMCLSFRVTNEVKQVYAGTQSGKVYVWSLKSMRTIGNFKSGDDSCISINIPRNDTNSKTIIIQNKSGKISFWEEESNIWNLTKEINTNFFGFCKAFVFHDTLYTSLEDNHCQAISVKTQTKTNIFNLSGEGNLGAIMSLKVFEIQSDLFILVAYEGYHLILWSLKDQKKISDLQLTECPMAFDFSVNTSKGICGNPSNKVDIFSLNKSLELKMVKTLSLVNSGVASVQIRPDSKIVAIGCWDGKIRLYSWKTLTLLAALDTHSSTVQDLCFVNNKEIENSNPLLNRFLLLAGSKDCKMSLWDIYN